MPTCPNGHQSGSDDWCEVCGHRMAGAGAPAGAVPRRLPRRPRPVTATRRAPAPMRRSRRSSARSAAPRVRRWRRSARSAGGTSSRTRRRRTPRWPRSTGPGPGCRRTGARSEPAARLPGAAGVRRRRRQQRDPFEYQSSRPSQVNRPAEPLSGPGEPHAGSSGRPGPQQPPNPFQQQGPPPPPSFQQQTAPPQPQVQQPGGDDWMLPPPSQPQAPQAPQRPEAAAAAAAPAARSRTRRRRTGRRSSARTVSTSWR